MDDKSLREINSYINTMWKFIKAHNIPAQNNIEAWDKIVDDIEKLKGLYDGNTPKDKLFRQWMVAYMDYMSDMSKGVPTLTQEAREAVKGL